MKKVLVPMIAAIVCAAAAGLFGQSASPAPKAGPSATPWAHRRARADTASLTSEEKEELEAAAQKALQDPKVQAAAVKMHEAMQVVRDGLLARDKASGLDVSEVDPMSSPEPAGTPGTAAARDQQESANRTAEVNAWQKASAEFHDTMRQAMIAADPSVAAILAKMAQSEGRAAGEGSGSPAALPER